MNVLGLTSDFVFSGNPVIITETWPDHSFDRRGARFEIELAGKKIYEGRCSSPMKIDISEILDSALPDIKLQHQDNDGLFMSAVNLSERKVRVSAEYSEIESDVDFFALQGGISRQNLRVFAEKGEDIFSARFLNPKCNFFLTTRTHSHKIVIRETELFPLYFILAEDAFDVIEIVAGETGKKIIFAELSEGIYGLDLRSLRKEFYRKYGVIPSILDVYRNRRFSCRIVVEKSELQKNRYYVVFRNSFGVFDLIELSGNLELSPEFNRGATST